MELENQIIEVFRNGEWVMVKDEDLKPGETFRIKPLDKELKYVTYLHSTKEDNYTKASEFGLEADEKFMEKFIYTLYEIKLNMKLDIETAQAWILGVNDVKLEKPVKAN